MSEPTEMPKPPEAGLTPSQGTATLNVENLVAGYATGVPIVRGLTMSVREGEIVTVVGPNGAGKSTLLKSIVGLTAHHGGSIQLRGTSLERRPAHEITRLGVGYVPQRRNVFPSISVVENLELPMLKKSSRAVKGRIEELYEMFPRLKERRASLAGALSGGERQMLAIAMALGPRPSILLLDEPTAGLSPALTDETFLMIQRLNATGLTIFMVEQNARAALEISTRGYVLELGKEKLEGPAGQLLHDPQVAELYLGSAAIGV